MADNTQQLTLADLYRGHLEEVQIVCSRIHESLEVQPAIDGDERLRTLSVLQAEIDECKRKLTRAEAREQNDNVR